MIRASTEAAEAEVARSLVRFTTVVNSFGRTDARGNANRHHNHASRAAAVFMETCCIRLPRLLRVHNYLAVFLMASMAASYCRAH